MKKRVSVLFCLALLSVIAGAQSDSTVISGIEIIPPVKMKGTRTNIYFSGGLQNSAWYKVPMVPVSLAPEMVRYGDEVVGQGWFVGLGASKPTDLHLEFGIMLNYFYSSVPVAYNGENSTSAWILEQTGTTSISGPYPYSINRQNSVYSIRTFARYNVNFKPMNFWIAGFAGTFSSSIKYTGEGQTEDEGTFNATSLGVNFQTGIDLGFYDKMGRLRSSLTLFADFLSPHISESIFGLFEDNWLYKPEDKTIVISPVRFGVMLGLH